MTFRVLIELKALPGRRGEVVGIVDHLLSGMDAVPGFIGLARYEDVDDPDKVIEIVDWESSRARSAWLEEAETKGILDPLETALAEPSKATVIRPLS